MIDFAKIQEHPTLIRDLSTQAVLTTDQTVVRKHEKRILDLQKESVRDAEIKNMRIEISEMRQLLQSLSNIGCVRS